MGYKVRREGDTWLYGWAEYGISVVVDHVHEARDGVLAELAIRELSANGTGGQIHTSRLALLSSSGREAMLRYLRGRGVSYPDIELGREQPVPWADVLEIVCARTATEYRAGAPVVRLDEVAIPEGSRYLLHPVLPCGETTILYGPGGSLKSLFALACAMAVAGGVELPHLSAPAYTGPVLYLDWESNAVEHAERYRWLMTGFKLPTAPPVHYRQMHQGVRDTTSDLRRLREQLHAVLVIYDSLAGAVHGDLNDADMAVGTLNAMRYIGGDRLAIAHESKVDIGRTSRASPFGSIFFENYARSLWEVRAGEDRLTNVGRESERTIALFHRKVNRGRLHTTPLGYCVCWLDDPAIRLIAADPMEDEALEPRLPLRQRLRHALLGATKTSKELGEELSANPRTVDRTLRRMTEVYAVNAGVLGRGAEALWALKSDTKSDTLGSPI